jgi:hypothetical protein
VRNERTARGGTFAEAIIRVQRIRKGIRTNLDRLIRTTDAEFVSLDFHETTVQSKTLNILYPDAAVPGPFCRLLVTAAIPCSPGVYSWCVDEAVMYVGMSGELCQVVQGQRMARPYNDYTYMPESQAKDLSDPRVFVNGNLNRALSSGSKVTWWWTGLATIPEADALERRLRIEWSPPWNRI